MRSKEAGVTLIEVTIAVTLLSLLTVGMSLAIRAGLTAYSKTEAKLMENRRIAGAQRILQQELEGLIPAFVSCGAGPAGGGQRAALFQGTPNAMWLATTFSLQQGWRGLPQLLQMFVIPGGEHGGVRLVVNEIPYSGPYGAGQYCTGTAPISGTISRLALFQTPVAGPKSFVLADELASCRFSYYAPSAMLYAPPGWQPAWSSKGWPWAVRIDMTPLAVNPSLLQPISVTAPIRIRRDSDKVFTDDY